MASDIGDGDYLGAYRRFFVDFLEKVNPDDQLPIKTSGHDVTEGEIVGEIIHMTLQYLDQQLCPPSLQCYIVQLVIEEIKATCRKQPENCGFRQEEKTYAPLKLMQAVTGKVNEICQRYLENSRLALLPPPPSTPMPLATAFAIRNNRRKMEDRHVVLHDLNTIFNIKDDSIASYYAVFDGHGGYHAAVFCATHLHQYLAESRHYPTDPDLALHDAFLTTDASFIEKSAGQTLSSGTTAVVALILKRKLYIAWVGDSQAALAKRGVVAQLVNPHRPDRNDERERVEEMGGTVMHRGIWRVNGNLAVSRAIGDAQYKPYVTGDPEIRCITLDGHEDFLIIACDGLWDCVTENEAAELVYRDLCRDSYDYGSASQRLVEYAKNQGSIDNITVIVVFLSTPRQIISRSTYGNPLLADVQMNNMEPDNRYLSNANGQYDVNSAFVKQQSAANNGASDMNMDDEYGNHDDRSTGNYGTSDMNMEDEYGNHDHRSINGKHHKNGDKVADYDVDEDDDDLGPETDVDAVDDASEPITTLANVSRQLFTDKPDPDEIYRNDECMDDDYSSSPNPTKTHQRTVVADADNVGDSEDSEDEWNYYRIDPNKEEAGKDEEAGAAGFSPVPKSENEVDVAPASLDVPERPIDLEEEKAESSKNSTDSSSDSESEREIATNVLIDTELSAEPIIEPASPRATESEHESEGEEVAEKEDEKAIVEKEDETPEEANMDFQLNPDAAEFVPVSPTLSMPPRIDLDVPIAGSPLKQTPPMDDIEIPSRREFENEARYRPHEIDEKNCANGRLLENLEDAPAHETPTEETSVPNLDESEISSTKAEFGDESSFLVTSEFQRTGVSTLDSSYTGSYGEFEESSVDPMTKSFGPSEFMALGDPVDLNAVHDLTDADLMVEGEEAGQERESETEKNIRNTVMDTEFATSQSPHKSLTDHETDDLMDYSPSVPVLHSPINQTVSYSETRENTEMLHDDHFSTSNLQTEHRVDETSTEKILKFDDIDAKESALDSQSPPALPDVQPQADVTSRLLEMDLEDRGSQDCGINKCTVMWKSREDVKDVSAENEEPAEHLSSPLSEKNLAETLNLEESQPAVTAKTESFSEIDNIEESVKALHLNDDVLSSQHSSASQVPVMQNPLDLHVASPSEIAQDNILLEYDSYRTLSEAPQGPDSPDVGVSPLVENHSKNPFNQMEFGNSLSCAQPQENNIFAAFEHSENVKGLDLESPLEQKSPLEDEHSLESPLEDEVRFKEDNRSDDKSPLEETSPLDDPSPLEHKSPLEEASPLDAVSPSKPKIPLEEQNLLKDKTFAEDERLVEPKCTVEDETPVKSEELYEDKNLSRDKISLEDEEPLANSSSDDKVLLEGESPLVATSPADNSSAAEEKVPIEQEIPTECENPLEHEITHQESETIVNRADLETPKELKECDQQLIPENVTNGLAPHANASEVHNAETKESCVTEEMVKTVSEEIEQKITELAEAADTKTSEEKTELVEIAGVIAASVAATVAAVGGVAAAKSAKTKPVGKVAPRAAAPTKTGVNKPAVTSPTKQATPATTKTSGAAKKAPAAVTAPTRPNKLETVSKTSASTTLSAKSSAATTTKVAAKSTKPTARPSTTTPKAKTPAVSSKPAVPGEKKPTSNGDAAKSSVTTATRLTSTSTRVSSANSGKPLVKTSTASGAKTSTTSTTSTTTTNSRSKTAAATATAKSTNKTTTAVGTTGITAQRPKTAPSTGAVNLAAKSRLSSSTKSPTTEKQIKDTANKQISSSRTVTTTTASKTSRLSGVSSNLATTRRPTAAKATGVTSATTVPTVPPPIKKPTSATRVTASKTTTANGKVSATKTTTTKTKTVVENGVYATERDVEVVTCTTTTTMTMNDANEEDVPKKDISPIEPPTDNQLIVTAD